MGPCTKVAPGTDSATLTGLTPATTYVYKAYRYAHCNWWGEFATVSFNTDGIALSATKVIVPEESSATYTVALATAPTATVTLTLTKDTGGDGDITFDTDSVTTGKQNTLTFSTTNWSTTQTVTVFAEDDVNKTYDTATIIHTAASTDTKYSGKTARLSVSEGDDDVCSGTTAVGGSLVTTGGLVDDCNTLLALEANLANTSTVLNWATTLAIGSWTGITTSNNSVTQIHIISSALNNLDGIVPATLGDLTELTTLKLNDNDLTGRIPATLGDLTKLTTLNLHNNDLTGEIPATLGDLTELTTLNLHNNDLTGRIPAKLGDLTSTTTI